MRIPAKVTASILVAWSFLVAAPARATIYGPCLFNSTTLTFGGTVGDTAACLLRRVKERGAGAESQPIPQWLVRRMARPIEIAPGQLRQYLAAHGIVVQDLTSTIAIGDTPRRRYFVIHDTSSPELLGAVFPGDINEASFRGNALTGWDDTSRRVNLITSRDGRSRLLRDWSLARPAPATKIEENRRVPSAREVFVHVENIQPRLNPDRSFFWQAPVPGLGAQQEQRLALAYIVASLRAGRWLIPAYHFNIDEGLPNGHDDPQHMDLASWVGRVEAIVAEMSGLAGSDPVPTGQMASSCSSPSCTPPAASSSSHWPGWVDLSRWADVSEDYRDQFALCDSVNRFRGIQLPQTIADHHYYACSSDPSSVWVLRRFSATTGLPGGAVAFTSKLAIDLDGSWFACNTPGHTDQCSTSLTLSDARNHEVGVSSDFVPYVVIPVRGPTAALSREFRDLTGTRIGDVGMLLTPSRAIPVIVADGGPFSKLGEGSIALHRELGRELCDFKNADGACRTMAPHMGSMMGPFVTIIFPGSRMTGLTPANIAARMREQALRYWRYAAPLLGRQP